MPSAKKSRKIFAIALTIFLLLIVLVTYDMARRTTAPWNKPKQIERALPTDTIEAVDRPLDSLLREKEW